MSTDTNSQAGNAENPYIKKRDADIILSTELHKIAAQEYDKQIVYIAGGGLALTLTFATNIVKATGSNSSPVLFLTWVAFATALLSNLLSHRKATEVHSLTRSLHLYLRDCALPNATFNKSRREEIDMGLKKANKWLLAFNRASEVAIIIGMSAFIIFGILNVYSVASTNSPSANDQPTVPTTK